MHLGRHWTPEEQAPGAAVTLVLSYRFWRDVYGSDPSIVGNTVLTAGGSLPVIGVTGPGFDYPVGADAWANFRRNPEMTVHMLDAYARLRPGATIEQARAEFEPVMKGVLEELPNSDQSRAFVLTPLREYLLGDMSGALMILFGATGTLLLIACANVANLQLSRGAARAREIAIRSALGAERGRIVRQLLTESLVLAAIAGIIGVVLAAIAVTTLVRLAPADLPRLDEIGISAGVLLFAMAVALGAGVIFGLTPALRLASTDLRSVLQEESRGSSSGPGRNRAFAFLTAAQIALAAVLVIGAGLLTLSFDQLRNGDTGFDSTSVLTADVALIGSNYPDLAEDVGGVLRLVRELGRDAPGC